MVGRCIEGNAVLELREANNGEDGVKTLTVRRSRMFLNSDSLSLFTSSTFRPLCSRRQRW